MQCGSPGAQSWHLSKPFHVIFPLSLTPQKYFRFKLTLGQNLFPWQPTPILKCSNRYAQDYLREGDSRQVRTLQFCVLSYRTQLALDGFEMWSSILHISSICNCTEARSGRTALLCPLCSVRSKLRFLDHAL